jgi:hypothetical protein
VEIGYVLLFLVVLLDSSWRNVRAYCIEKLAQDVGMTCRRENWVRPFVLVCIAGQLVAQCGGVLQHKEV